MKTKGIHRGECQDAKICDFASGKYSFSVKTKRVYRDAKFFVDLPAANSQIFALLNMETAPNTGLGKGFEKFAEANFLEESNNRSLRLSVLGGEKTLNAKYIPEP